MQQAVFSGLSQAIQAPARSGRAAPASAGHATASCSSMASSARLGSRGVFASRGNAVMSASRRQRGVVCMAGDSDILIDVKGLEAKITGTDQQILNGLDITLRKGEVHAIMGKNGSGKSTLSKCLVGHPAYEVTSGSATYMGEDLLEMDPEERSHKGLFLSFQSPIEVPGVSNTDFLRMSCNARRKANGQPELDPLEFYADLMPKLEALKMDISYLNRNVNEGFSGGEKKRNEILQLAVLDADVAILDEIDSGLDIDALREVADAVNGLRSENKAILMITHYQRLLDYIKPDYVHIMKKGKIIQTGGPELALTLEEGGYAALDSY
eukprot:CAMPEP_0182913534 /NCGR_PEP_ID=MMETSP0034_2-20130328/38091_1 /TAXON_ID=156128 /ORGANISM="Nephroselmis pyriformis, Strain CCMP717" /LENGTH=324 /DNA_ID=CAMNT_0025050261 /DNA_START=123 /DNA_END=1094 /DNA_ORIENTATION=+